MSVLCISHKNNRDLGLFYLDIHHINMYCPKNMQNAGPVFPHNLLTPAYSSRLRGECSMINYVLRCACCVFHKKNKSLVIWLFGTVLLTHTHCPKNNLNLHIKTEPVTVHIPVYVWFQQKPDISTVIRVSG